MKDEYLSIGILYSTAVHDADSFIFVRLVNKQILISVEKPGQGDGTVKLNAQECRNLIGILKHTMDSTIDIDFANTETGVMQMTNSGELIASIHIRRFANRVLVRIFESECGEGELVFNTEDCNKFLSLLTQSLEKVLE